MKLQGENVLVTGGAGFIGSALVRALIAKGSNVIVYDNFRSGDIKNIEEILDKVVLVTKDILDFKSLLEVLNKYEVKYVFHLAAEPYVPRFYEDPAKFFEINANGTLNVLLACKKAGVERIVHYSTSEVYGPAKYVPMDEEHPTNPQSTYAVSKLAADRLCYTLCHEQKIPVVILRQFNVYGPRETQPYVIPEIISQLSRSNVVRLGNIKARRDFTYVEDAVEAAIELMKCDGVEGEVFNVGTGVDWSVEELVHEAASIMKKEEDVKIVVEKNRLRPLDVNRLQCDYTKFSELTRWKPKTPLREGLKKTIRWFWENGRRWIWEERLASEEELWKARE